MVLRDLLDQPQADLNSNTKPSLFQVHQVTHAACYSRAVVYTKQHSKCIVLGLWTASQIGAIWAVRLGLILNLTVKLKFNFNSYLGAVWPIILVAL